MKIIDKRVKAECGCIADVQFILEDDETGSVEDVELRKICKKHREEDKEFREEAEHRMYGFWASYFPE